MENQPTKNSRDREIIVTLVLSLIFMWSGFFLTQNTNPLKFATNTESENKKIAEQKAEQEKTKQEFFGPLNLEAKAYVVYNLETGEIVASRNENKILPLASLTKVMTVLAASELLEPRSKVIVQASGSDMTGGLKQGERWQMANLAALTLVSSSNEGAASLAEAVASGTPALISAMNKKAAELNLNSLHYTNPTGLDDGPAPGGQGTALDIAKLFSYILKNKAQLLEETREPLITIEDADGSKHTALNTNEIINEIPGLIAGKTGYTELAGGNLAVAANIGLHRPLVFVVLGSSKEGRFSDTKKLTSAATNYYAAINN